MGGYFLEYNNFVPADPLKTPAHIAPVWYFTPYYSILRAITSDFILWGLTPFLLIFLAVVWMSRGTKSLSKLIATLAVGAMLVGFLVLDAKFWGVVAMGASVMIFFAMPWIDNSEVKSIRYRPGWHKYMYAAFVIVFLVLGYTGVQPPSPVAQVVAQVGTLLYFAFFLFMPWWSAMGEFKPVPDRVTFAAH
jgi:ubiquinol-cytochrome c reductase cytochrome b subunit